jgi:uncharacterized membrane protein YfcA
MTILDLSVWWLLLVAVCALGTQVIGGLAGYGTGLLMPLVLVPVLGAEAIVPVIGVSGMITNVTRAWVFRAAIDWHRAMIMCAAALPTTILGAWAFTHLSSRGAAFVVGTLLLVLIPLRRALKRASWTLGLRGGALGAVGYGFLTGGGTGAGVILLALLMSMGLTGKAVIATDAMASIVLGIAKTGVFAAAGELPPKLWLVAGIIGAMAVPGSYIARWLIDRFSARVHDLLLEAVIAVGAMLIVGRAIGA